MPADKKPSDGTRGKTTFEVSTGARPQFDQPLMAFAFDETGALLEATKVGAGKLTFNLTEKEVQKARVFLLPATEEVAEAKPTPARLEKLNAFQPVLRAGPDGASVRVIDIPGPILDFWPHCFCVVRGQVLRSADGRPVCNARVHICEVDRLPIWIMRLPERDIFRLRDDLLDALRNPRIPFPPEPIPDPPGPWPGPDPAPFQRPLFRVMSSAPAGFPTEGAVPRMLSTASTALPPEVSARLASSSPTLVRTALADHWKLILPYLCLWPWWWRFRCDEIAVVTTDAHGRFLRIIAYPCLGDHPDLYFWVEYDFGGGFETVYKPAIACHTYWNYPCGSDVTIHVRDPRVPSCGGEGSPGGKEVWVISVGRTVSIGEIYTSADGPLEGMVREPWLHTGPHDYAFGGKLEPRVWFGRANLIGAGITHYLWSVRPLGGTELDWRPLNRQVIRHYTTGVGTAPVDIMGPEPGGSNKDRFRIRPMDPPTGGIEWLVADEREDLATAHFVTGAPEVPDPMPECGVADPKAGKYELKMELFDSTGALVNWDDKGITLRIATNEAPFGVDPVLTKVAENYNRIRAGGKTVAFRMVLHVDNSRCGAVIDAIAGAGITVNPDCGVVTLTGAAPTLDVGFRAGRPGGLAYFDFDTERGLSTDILPASAAGHVSDANVNGFGRTAPCHFSKAGIPTSTFLGACSQAAFSEHLRVWALSQDGYHRLSGLDAYDVAAFMLTEPCPPCPPCDGDGGAGQGQGQGQGRGQ